MGCFLVVSRRPKIVFRCSILDQHQIFFSYFFQVDLRHIDEENNRAEVEIGVDLTEFYMSVEWDILEVPAIRNVKYYTCCDEPYLDITFNVTMRFVHITNLFVTSKNEFSNSPIHEFKVLHKSQRAFLKPFLMVY